MSNVVINKQKIDILANVISAKSGVPVTMTLDEMVDAVEGIQSPTGTINIDDDGTYDVTNYASAEVAIDYVAKTLPMVVVNHTSVAVTVTSKLHSSVVSNGYIYKDAVVIAAGGDSLLRMERGMTLIRFNHNDNFDVKIDGVVKEPVAVISKAKIYGFSVPTSSTIENPYTVDIYDSADPWPAEIVAEPLSVTVNGTYTAPSGTAYSPVTVNVQAPAQSLQTKSITPTESQQTVTPDSGYYGLDEVTVGAISTDYVGSGVTRRSSSDLTASGATVTAPAGYYASSATKTVASGTAGTPTATKGTVSNHSITVTPSVTNTTGYITGGTKNGTSVSVSASELVSGTVNVNSAGTWDVTNYESAVIPTGGVVAPGEITGTAATVTTGTNTLTLTKTVSVTPSVSNPGYVTAGTAGNASVSLTASVTTKAAATITPGTSNQTIAAGTYLTGTQTIAGDADLIAGNILSTANIFGVQGSVVIQHYYTGSSAPASSLGVNGDIYLRT